MSWRELSRICFAPGEGGAGGGTGEGAGGAGAGAGANAGTGGTDWKAGLPDDLKGHASLAAINDLPSLAKSYINAQELVGKKGIIPPGEGATETDWNAFYNQLGRPETPDKYEIKKPEQLPEGFPYSEDLEKGFRETAHKLGLTPKQVAGLFEWNMQENLGAFNAIAQGTKAKMEETSAALKKEYGAAYDQKIQIGQSVVKKFADPDAIEALEAGLGNDPRLVRMFVKMGEAMGEDKLLGQSTGGLALTPQQAQEEIAKITGDAKSPYFNNEHPEHKITVEKVAKLYQQAYPQPA